MNTKIALKDQAKNGVRRDGSSEHGGARRALCTCAVVIGGLISVCYSALAQDQKASPPEKAQLIASIQGPALYKAYCASCHGIQGKGDGPMAKSLKIRVADLTRIAERNGGTFPRMRVERVILGEEAPAGHGTREMPLWGPIFSQVSADQDLGRVRVDNLARFLETMQVK
jgi:mono/diheme cytochrome c family protein